MDTTPCKSVECPFCRKKFASKSTYGRHLDSKRADSLHPAEEVDALRKNVVRRGERGSDEVRQEKQKIAKQKASRAYNLKDDVKERNKRRRKERDVRIKASLKAYAWYTSKLAKSEMKEPVTFLEMVAVYLPVSQWPKPGEYPGESELQKLLATLVGKSSADGVFGAWDAWKRSEGDKEKKWRDTSNKMLQETLQNTSLWEIVRCQQLINEKCKEGVENLQGGFLDMLMSGEESQDMIE